MLRFAATKSGFKYQKAVQDTEGESIRKEQSKQQQLMILARRLPHLGTTGGSGH